MHARAAARNGHRAGSATLELFERILKGTPAVPREIISGSPVSRVEKPAAQVQKVRALVGRRVEWHRLAGAWESAIEQGPRVAMISGEPGIGKTRIADVLFQLSIRHGQRAAG